MSNKILTVLLIPRLKLNFYRASGLLSVILQDRFNLVSQAVETRPLVVVVCPALLHQAVHLVLQSEEYKTNVNDGTTTTTDIYFFFNSFMTLAEKFVGLFQT